MDLRSCATLEFLNLTVQDSADGESTSAFWFAVDGARVVTVLTDERIADAVTAEPEVLVGFSDLRGDTRSGQALAVARRLGGDESRRAASLLNEKYGWRRRSFRFMFWFTRRLGSAWDREDHAFELHLQRSDEVSPYSVPSTELARSTCVEEVETAEVVVNAAAMKRALDHLTEVAVPLGIRVAVHRDEVELSFHDPDQGWWATTTCPGVDTDPASDAAGTSVGVTVPRLIFREAIEIAQLDPVLEKSVTVVAGESVHFGATAIASAQSWPTIPAPPSFIGLTPAHDDLLLPSGTWEADEKVSFAAGPIRLTVMGAFLDRFAGRGIEHVALYTDPDGSVIVGTTSEDDLDARLVLIAPAHPGP
jgi:hypothetical protein